MQPLRGERRCFTHSPRAARQRAAARSKGGRRRRIAKATTPAPVATINDLQHHVGAALADVQLLENTTKRGGVIARLVLVAARLIETGELAERLGALEDRMDMLDREGRRR